MQSDGVVWDIISKGFCSFKVKTAKSDFCRNPYNLNGLCNGRTCPLANSRYATVREYSGKIFLLMKTRERAHQPRKMWEKVSLSNNYETALKQIDRHLIYWPKHLIHKCKQRFTKITQYLIRMRKLKLKTQRKIVPLNRKVEKRETRREGKALVAAKLETAIERELLERLKKGTYGDIYNFPTKAFEKALDQQEIVASDEEEEEVEYVAEDEIEESDLSDIEGLSISESEEEEIEIAQEKESNKVKALPSRKTLIRNRPHVKIEYETELEPAPKPKAIF